MAGPLASIIIRCLNEEQHIGRLLESLQSQTLQDFEVIVVDSGSTDNTLAIVRQYPVRVYTIQPEDFSFGYALNYGCQRARGEFLVFISAHAYPARRDWLQHLLAMFGDPEVALVYGKQRGNEVTVLSEHEIFAKWFPEESVARQDSPFCNNANAVVRRSVWEELPYNEELTALEDIDWVKRAMQRGYHIAYYAEAEIIHVHNEPPERIYNRYRREAIALKTIFPEEHFGLWDFLRLYVLNVVNDLAAARRARSVWAVAAEILTFRLMQFWGTYRGFAWHKPLTSDMKRRLFYPPGYPSQTTKGGHLPSSKPDSGSLEAL